MSICNILVACKAKAGAQALIYKSQQQHTQETVFTYPYHLSFVFVTHNFVSVTYQLVSSKRTRMDTYHVPLRFCEIYCVCVCQPVSDLFEIHIRIACKIVQLVLSRSRQKFFGFVFRMALSP